MSTVVNLQNDGSCNIEKVTHTGGSTNTKVEDDLEAKIIEISRDKLYQNMSRYVKLSPAATAKFQPKDLGNLDSSRYPSLKKEWAGTLLKSAIFHNNTRKIPTQENYW